MNKLKLTHQLFIGKVSEVIGEEKTAELLKECKEVFSDFPDGNAAPSASQIADEAKDCFPLDEHYREMFIDGAEWCRKVMTEKTKS